MAQPASERLAYSPEEAAHQLGISRSKLYEYLHDGSLPSVKLGRSRRITHEALMTFLAGNAA